MDNDYVACPFIFERRMRTITYGHTGVVHALTLSGRWTMCGHMTLSVDVDPYDKYVTCFTCLMARRASRT